MKPFRILALAAAALLISCITLPDVDEPHAEIQVVTPAETTYTNGTLEVRLEIKGTPPDKVELLVDDGVLTTLEPPYAFQWNTATVSEGRHRVRGRVQIGNETFTSEPREVVVDRTPPQVVSRTPAPGAQDVWVRQPIQATFSEPMKASTLTDASVRLTLGNLDIARMVSLSSDGLTLTATPASNLSVPNTVSLTLTTALTDLAGNALTLSAESWTWKTPEFVPLPALPKLHPEPSDVMDIHFRLDRSDNPVVAWLESSNQASNIHVARWADGTWHLLGEGLRIRPAASHGADQPSLAIDATNTPLLSWHEGDGSNLNDHIHVARWTGTQWAQVGNNSGISPDRPYALGSSLQLDAGNNPIVAWSTDFEDPIDGASIQVARWTNTAWNFMPPPANFLTSNPSKPELSTDISGSSIFIAWTRPSTPRAILQVSRWTENQWLSLGTSVNSGTDDVVGPVSLAITSTGSPVIAWPTSPSATANASIAISTWNGSQWLPIGNKLTSTPETPATLPSLLLDNSDRPIIAWSQSATPQSPAQVHISRWTGTSWDSFAPLSAYPGVNTSTGKVSLQLNSHGLPWAAWTEFNGTSNSILVYRYNQ